MEAHEMQDHKLYASQVVVEEEKRMVSNAYPGARTDGTRNTQTRVRVSRVTPSFRIVLTFSQRLFNFTQIFFFALTVSCVITKGVRFAETQ
jgi:hypothetical protein